MHDDSQDYSDSETEDDNEASAAPEEGAKKAFIDMSFEEARVLGCLLEKEATTPDHYPLTLNALISACNQSSNREPVVSFEGTLVEQAMEDLRYSGLGMLVHQAGARVPKFKHTLENKLPYLTTAQQALLCVLLLRGQQTSGELRQRTERMHPFSDVAKVEAALEALMENDPHPLVKKFPPGDGRRVASYMHLLSGVPGPSSSAAGSHAASGPAETTSVGSPTWRATLEDRVEQLESEVTDLKTQLDQLRADLGA